MLNDVENLFGSGHFESYSILNCPFGSHMELKFVKRQETRLSANVEQIEKPRISVTGSW
jgi:hypothetical protein